MRRSRPCRSLIPLLLLGAAACESGPPTPSQTGPDRDAPAPAAAPHDDATPTATVKPAPAPDRDALLAEAREHAAQLRDGLQARLGSAMKEGGPSAALSACRLAAPEVTAAASTAGWQVGRTALRVRNPANSADEWERAVLQDFEARIAHGEDPSGLEADTFEPMGRRFRYMKAIPTGEPCLVCHGAALDPELVAQLDELYPQDAARGFRAGELRGAFTLDRQLE